VCTTIYPEKLEKISSNHPPTLTYHKKVKHLSLGSTPFKFYGCAFRMYYIILFSFFLLFLLYYIYFVSLVFPQCCGDLHLHTPIHTFSKEKQISKAHIFFDTHRVTDLHKIFKFTYRLRWDHPHFHKAESKAS
jgi:hypothetical protein